MSTLADAIRAVVGGITGNVNDGLMAYYAANGGVGTNVLDLERSFLLSQLGLASSLATTNDLWRMFLADEGYIGSLNDQQLAFWLAGGAVVANLSAIGIGLGQSLMEARLITAIAKASSNWSEARMPVDGVGVGEFAFYSANAENAANWTSIATMVPLLEQTKQSPMVGVADMLEGGEYDRAYLCSVAVGARSVFALSQAGPRQNMYGITKRMCDEAVAAGYEPRPFGLIAHGEANAATATTEEDYYDWMGDHIRMFRTYCKQILGDKDYEAPVYFSYPAQTNAGGAGENNRAINRAWKRLAADLDLIDFPTYPTPCHSDRTHNTDLGQVIRGETFGLFVRGVLSNSPRIVSVVLDGVNVTITYSRNVEKRTSPGVGSALNTSFAKNGFEWDDNGSLIAIPGTVTASGDQVTFALASPPVGTLAQQTLRYAQQTTTATLTSGLANLAGGDICAADGPAISSIVDPTFTHREWAIPEAFKAVTGP